MKLSPLIIIITPQPDGKGLFTHQMWTLLFIILLRVIKKNVGSHKDLYTDVIINFIILN